MSEQMKRGRAAYAQMKEACALLVESGNWQRVGASDIQLFLDMYTQALLLKMAQHTGSVSEEMRAFIAGVPSRDVLNIGRAGSEAALRFFTDYGFRPTGEITAAGERVLEKDTAFHVLPRFD